MLLLLGQGQGCMRVRVCMCVCVGDHTLHIPHGNRRGPPTDLTQQLTSGVSTTTPFMASLLASQFPRLLGRPVGVSLAGNTPPPTKRNYLHSKYQIVHNRTTAKRDHATYRIANHATCLWVTVPRDDDCLAIELMMTMVTMVLLNCCVLGYLLKKDQGFSLMFFFSFRNKT